MRKAVLCAVVICMTACKVDPTGRDASASATASPSAVGSDAADDPLGSNDVAIGDTAAGTSSDDRPRPVMQLQVVLDRQGFTPGVVDGKEGLSTRNAIMGFQEANDLAITGKIDQPTKEALARWNNVPATRMVTIPADFAAGPFRELPDKPQDQAGLPSLGYETLDEKLAERFHTTIDTLIELNPRSAASVPSDAVDHTEKAPYFSANQHIRVPNVGADRIVVSDVQDKGWLSTLKSLGVGSSQPQAAKIVVSKSKGTLRAYDRGDTLIGMFTATMGSQKDPLPLGKWKITGVAHNPPFHYNPKLFWDVPDSHEKQLLPPGPNGPVGVVWIDLSKEHYGIHGTPEPQTIGRAQSHGCVRLTNWDVARLAQMVSANTEVLFEA
jgi:lipoprotein-anchoring transpeptidase ErfK/SrfK